MKNERLRGAMFNAGLTVAGLAAAVEVDVKSVQRWLTEGRVPYPNTRLKVAHALDQQETFLWPELLTREDPLAATVAEIDRVWPARNCIPAESWHALFSLAATEIDILVYSGGFLLETLDVSDLLQRRASEGVRVRVLVADPDSDAVKMRAAELSNPWLAERCRSTLRSLSKSAGGGNLCVRPNGSIPYLSLFRVGDVLLANVYAFGAWGSRSPVLQLRCKSSEQLFAFYLRSFERVWEAAEQPRPSRS